MSLTTAEEAQVRALLAQQSALLALAAEESDILSSLAATDATLSDLSAASSLGDTDILLVRQSGTDKSITGAIVKSSATVPIATASVAGKVKVGSGLSVAGDGLLSATGSSVQGAFKNLQSSATGSSASISVSADEIAVEDTSNQYQILRNVSLTINSASTGANGLDTGTLATNTWYSVWIIYNGTTTAGLISTSDTSPTMPSGYTYKARIGWVRTDGTANKYPLAFLQRGRRVHYKVAAGTNVTSYPNMSSGAQGNTTTPTWAAVSSSAFVPSTASVIRVMGFINATNGIILVAPNNSFSGFSTTTNPAPIVISTGGDGGQNKTQCDEFILESSSIYVASTSDGRVYCVGWEDNL